MPPSQRTLLYISAALIMVCLIILRLEGLSEGRLIHLDEYRVALFSIDHTSLFRLLYSSLGRLAGGYHDAFLDLSSLFSIATIFTVYFISRVENGDSKGAGIIACTVFACSATQAWYARSAYPVAMASAILTVSIWVWSRERRSQGISQLCFLALFGASQALLLLTYLAWYPLVIALTLTAGCSGNKNPNTTSRLDVVAIKEGTKRLFAIFFGFSATYALGIEILTSIAGVPVLSWFSTLFEIQQWGATFVPDAPLVTLTHQLFEILRKEAPLTVATLVVLVFARPRLSLRATFPQLLTIAAILGLALAVIPALLGVNTLYERNLAGYVVVIVIALGLTIAHTIACNINQPERIGAQFGVTARRSAYPLLLALFLFSTLNVLTTRREMFRIEPILSWLTAKGAKPHQVVSLVDLAPSVYSPASENVTNLPHIQLDRPSRPRLVLWDQLDKIAQENPQLRYLLLTNFYMQQVKGKREILLWNSAPFLAEFVHPESSTTSLRIYDLQDARELANPQMLGE